MDYPLGAIENVTDFLFFVVLIPILMDYPLGACCHETTAIELCSLNPYSNGLPSRGV